MLLGVGVALGLIILLSGAPIFIAFVIAATIILVGHLDVTQYAISLASFSAVTKYALVALPPYMLVGHLMLQGGLARRMTDSIGSWVGHFRGGLAIATIIALALFAAISGSILAGIVTIGTIMIPVMVRNGYPRPMAAAIIASAAGLDTLIPPSSTGILYSSITGTPLAQVFMAGLIPGIVQALLLLITVRFLCRRMPTLQKASWRQRFEYTYKAIPIFILPVIILGSIYSGLLLPSEAGAVACVYAIFVGIVIYRELTLSKLWQAFLSTGRTCAVILIMIAGASLLSQVFIYTRIPFHIAEALVGFGLTPLTFLIMSMFAVLILGTFMEAVPLILVTVPMFMTIAQNLGIDLIHFYVPFCIFVGIGLLTPPVSVGAYTAASVSGESPDRVMKYIFPWFLVTLLLSGFLNVFIPQLSTWLPGTMR